MLPFHVSIQVECFYKKLFASLIIHKITDDNEKVLFWKDSSWKVRLWHTIQTYQTSENPDEWRHNEQANFTQASFLVKQGKWGFISFIASPVSCEALHWVCRGVKAFLPLSEILSWASTPSSEWIRQIIHFVWWLWTLNLTIKRAPILLFLCFLSLVSPT